MGNCYFLNLTCFIHSERVAISNILKVVGLTKHSMIQQYP